MNRKRGVRLLKDRRVFYTHGKSVDSPLLHETPTTLRNDYSTRGKSLKVFIERKILVNVSSARFRLTEPKSFGVKELDILSLKWDGVSNITSGFRS